MAFLFLAGVSLLITACRSDRIPREDMKIVLKELILTDLQISSSEELKRLADSSWVYAPVLRKFGYTDAQFYNTVSYYIGRPDRFRSLLSQLRNDVTEERRQLTAYLEGAHQQKLKLERFIAGLKDSVPSPHAEATFKAFTNLLPADSADLVWRMDRDSLYRLPANRLLPVLDTISQIDSIPMYLAPIQAKKPKLKLSISFH